MGNNPEILPRASFVLPRNYGRGWKWVVMVVGLMLLLVWLLPPTNVPDGEIYKKREAFLLEKLGKLERRNADLLKLDAKKTELLALVRDSLRVARGRTVADSAIYYSVRSRPVRRYGVGELDSVFGLPVAGVPVASYSLPVDTVNVLLVERAELRAARPYIASLEQRVRIQDRYISEADSLLAVRKKRILNDSVMLETKDLLYANMVASKDAEIARGKRRLGKVIFVAVVEGVLLVLSF